MYTYLFKNPNLIRLRSGLAAMMISMFCLTQLSGCGVADQTIATTKYDAPPPIEPDPAKIRNAVPRVEPYHPYGRRDYVIKGRRYKVLKSAKGYVRKGYASWYGSQFHGKETSTQERFNLYGMTAASPHLPLPSYVEVTNRRNGKKVIVRVNDRGPFVKNRIIDLSYAAAKKLGFAEKGVAPVKVVAIDAREWAKNNSRKAKTQFASNEVSSSEVSSQSESKLSDNKSKVFLQLGAFSELNNAKELSSKATKVVKKKPVHIEHKSNLYRVQIGPLTSSDETDELKVLLEQHGFAQINLIEG